MIVVQFSRKDDCDKIYERLQAHIERGNYDEVFSASVKQTKKTLYIMFHRDDVTFQHVIQPMISQVFASYIIDTYELTWVRDILREMFCYEDEEEIEAIMSLFCSITEGKRDDLPNVKRLPSRKRLIEDAVHILLEDSFKKELSFSFDSFLKFRMKNYRECLLTYVEMAIDEYKLEQDYQNFIDNLRSFLIRKRPLIDLIHVVYTDRPKFYDESFRMICEEQILSAMKQTAFLQHSLIEPTVLKPLLTFAPKKIVLFTDHDITGLFYTLKNIFQERLTIRSLKEAPDICFL